MRVSFDDGGSGGGPSGGGAAPTPVPEARPLGRALWRGARGLCPHCGVGPIFSGYLTVVPACAVCGEALHHHRADDLPPYLTMLVVGHVVVTGLLVGEKLYQPDVTLALAFWLPVTAVLALLLLRPIKGAVVALQWALRMHGFGRAPSPIPPAPPAVPLVP